MTVDVSTDSRGVTTLALDRPERHNALDAASIATLRATLDAVRGGTRVLVLAGTGRSFCAGADLDWMRASATLTDAENRADAEALSALLAALDAFPLPTVARVQGAAIGGGAGLVACCDAVVASDAARFAFSEVRLGLIPATISPYVVRAIGPREARRLFLSAARFDALEAYRVGLVHDVCSAANLDARVEAQVEAFLAGGPIAQGAAKRLVADVAGRPIDAALRGDTAERLAEVRAGDEAQEGIAAFLERREPAWRSR